MQINPATYHPLSSIPKNISKGKLMIRGKNRSRSAQSSMSLKKTWISKSQRVCVFLSISLCWALEGWVILPRVQMRAMKEGSSPDQGSWRGVSYALLLVLSPAGSGTSHTDSSDTSEVKILKHPHHTRVFWHCRCLPRVLGDLQMRGAAKLQSALGTSIN